MSVQLLRSPTFGGGLQGTTVKLAKLDQKQLQVTHLVMLELCKTTTSFMCYLIIKLIHSFMSMVCELDKDSNFC